MLNVFSNHLLQERKKLGLLLKSKSRETHMHLTVYPILLLIIPALLGLYCSIRLLYRRKYYNTASHLTIKKLNNKNINNKNI